MKKFKMNDSKVTVENGALNVITVNCSALSLAVGLILGIAIGTKLKVSIKQNSAEGEFSVEQELDL